MAQLPLPPPPDGPAFDDVSAAKTKDGMDQRLKDRHSKLKEKWALDRFEEVGEAGTISAASKAFWDQFKAERRKISLESTTLSKEPLETVELTTAKLNELTQRVLALSMLISSNTHSLPKYDVKRALNESAETRTLVEQTRGKLVPRKKFTFKSRQKNNEKALSAAPLTTATAGWVAAVAAAAGANAAAGEGVLGGFPVDEEGGCAAGSSSSSGAGGGAAGNTAVQEATHMLAGRTGETLVVAPGQLAGSGGSDYFLKDLTDCVVVFMETLSALKCVNLKGCRLFSGPVAGSVFARELVGCECHVAARQLRIHDSRDVCWFTRTSSPPIIEDCSAMFFSPYTVVYPGLSQHFTDSGLVGDGLKTTYKAVKDFKWHRAQASPNWALLEDKLTSATAREEASSSTNEKLDGGRDGEADSNGKLENKSAEYYRSLQLWKPPPAAQVLGLHNSLAPPSAAAETPAAQQRGETGDGSDDSDEDEL